MVAWSPVLGACESLRGRRGGPGATVAWRSGALGVGLLGTLGARRHAFQGPGRPRVQDARASCLLFALNVFECQCGALTHTATILLEWVACPGGRSQGVRSPTRVQDDRRTGGRGNKCWKCLASGTSAKAWRRSGARLADGRFQGRSFRELSRQGLGPDCCDWPLMLQRLKEDATTPTIFQGSLVEHPHVINSDTPLDGFQGCCY